MQSIPMGYIELHYNRSSICYLHLYIKHLSTCYNYDLNIIASRVQYFFNYIFALLPSKCTKYAYLI